MQYFIANWKMNNPDLSGWVAKMAPLADSEQRVVLCPPFTMLTSAQHSLKGEPVALGAQDCHAEEQGAYTGDISAGMLKQAGCSYVIIGHSERRQHHGETNAMVCAKAKAALAQGLTPVICVGESQAERELGGHESVVARQIQESVPTTQGNILIAYEPVWAIGTGLTAQADDILSMHSHIKKMLDSTVPVLYGGSVKPANAGEILSLEGVDGVLVGSASLKGDDFAGIIKAD